MDKAPDAFRTISEVAEWLGVQPHVLRFWESKFPQIKPVKRAGGRRYYRQSDMRLLGGLKKLLHEDGLTIKGAQKVLREQGVRAVQGMAPPLDEDGFEALPPEDDGPEVIKVADAGAALTATPPADLDVPDAAIPEASAPAFDDVVEETASDDTPDPQGSLDLPQIRRRARPMDAPASAPSPAQPAKSERAARTPPPATLFDDLPEAEAPAKAPEFRSRLGGMLGAEASAQAQAAAEEPAPAEPSLAEPAPAEPEAPPAAPASLPPADTPLEAALSMLHPEQVPAIRLRPIYDQLLALRSRMDAAG